MTEAWLKKFDVHYDQLVMGKLYAHAYIDDANVTIKEALEKFDE
jgi:hypothetical protein